LSHRELPLLPVITQEHLERLAVAEDILSPMLRQVTRSIETGAWIEPGRRRVSRSSLLNNGFSVVEDVVDQETNLFKQALQNIEYHRRILRSIDDGTYLSGSGDRQEQSLHLSRNARCYIINCMSILESRRRRRAFQMKDRCTLLLARLLLFIQVRGVRYGADWLASPAGDASNV